MKKLFITYLLIFAYTHTSAQKKTDTKKVNDTIKTEVVNVVSSFVATIEDAFKIKKNPTIQFYKNTKKKKLNYTIFSAPVASTFKPVSGVVKGISVGKKERIYNNYIAAGFGNNTTPFAELFLHYSTKFDNEFSLLAKYISSESNIKNTPLSSNYSKFKAGVSFQKEAHYFDWKISLHSAQEKYNWYGLPAIIFNTNTLQNIQEEQTYNLFGSEGKLTFKDSYINTVSATVSLFSDAKESRELHIKFHPKFHFPMYFLHPNLNDLEIDAKIEFLSGKFKKSYTDFIPVKYNFITASSNPIYRFKLWNFDLKTGLKLFFSADTKNSINDFFIYPDVEISYPIIKKYITAFVKASGDLHTNTYQKFVDTNPFVSPTLHITQTNEKYHFSGGFSGKITNNINFNIIGSYKNEEDKPLFIRNNSKSDGTFSSISGIDLEGYEFGNSFNVFYDDIKTFSLFAETEINITQKITVGINAQYNLFTVKKQAYAWNLPEIQGTIFGDYKNEKWYINSTIFIIGDRKDLLYNSTYPSITNGTQLLKSYIDANINGGYNFNDKFSTFIQLNNVLNTDYQRFANFNSQGFQVLIGGTWKFDF